MTQPPQLPPMPPPEPLDEAERALARALRNLPTATPPPELDARILGSARRAVHLATPRKRDNRRWLVGFGTAASALLAIGVLLKTHGPTRDAVYSPPRETTTSTLPTPANAPAADTAAASAPTQDGKDKSPIAADAVAPSGAASQAASGIVSDALAQPQEEPLRARAQQSIGGTAATAAKSSPQAFPVRQLPKPIASPAPAPVVMDEPVPMAVQSPAPSVPRALERDEAKDQRYNETRRDAEADQMSSGAPAAAGAVYGQTAQDQGAANKVAANAAPSSAPAPKQNDLDKVTITGARLKKETSSNLPAPTDDANLNPAEWIERVRERLRGGDRAGASASLHAFVRAHPDASIPDDLEQLLR